MPSNCEVMSAVVAPVYVFLLLVLAYFPFDLSFPFGLPDSRFPAIPLLSLAALVPANIGWISEIFIQIYLYIPNL